MKTNLIFPALLLFSASVFAQTNLVDEFPAMIKARNDDAESFFRTRLAPNVTFIAGHNGSLHNKNYVMSLFKAQKQQSAEITNLNIQQVGDLAVVTGISTVNSVFPNGKTGTYKDAFTYTLRWQNGDGAAPRWLFTNLHHTKIEYSVSGHAQTDEAAIKAVIEGLTTAIYARDYKTYLNAWAEGNYISRVGSYPDSGVTKVTGDDYRKQMQATAAKPGEPTKDKITRDNWLIRINGNSAFVVFDQYNARPDGTTRHSVEERYLERINSEWKLVNVTVLIAK
jgi:ketosteroid isomerase-like protein